MEKVRAPMRGLFALAVAGLFLSGATPIALAPTITWSFTGSGGHVVAGAYALDTTIGQSTWGHAVAGSLDLCVGFMCGATAYFVYLPVVIKP